jgi:hypothetical protein
VTEQAQNAPRWARIAVVIVTQVKLLVMRMTEKEDTADALKEEPRKRFDRFRPKTRLFQRKSSSNEGDVRDGPSSLGQQEVHTNTHARTAILTSYDPLQQMQKEYPYPSSEQTMSLPSTLSDEAALVQTDCSTAILQHSFQLCGRPSDVMDDDSIELTVHDDSWDLPEDPTIQESIECVFAHQLEAGLPLVDGTEEDDDDCLLEKELVSPATFLQSRQGRNRHVARSSSRRSKRPYHAGSLVHMGTYDPALGELVPPAVAMDQMSWSAPVSSVAPAHPCPCQCGVRTPLIPPEHWPQRPLLLRPTPGSGCRIIGIRFSSSEDYLWTEGDESSWVQKLHEHWKKPHHEKAPTGCPECVVLPMNNGNEPKGEALVADFESSIFHGTILVRVRHSEGTTTEPYNDDKGYFAGMNRRYQIVVRGRFKEEIPWTSCVAGLQLERPCGKLPPKWITNGALKVVSFFAPQLKTSTEGNRPYSLTPFGSTPQTLRVEEHAKMNESMEELQFEPIHDSHTLLGEAYSNPSSLSRARFRKKNFDKLFVAKSPTPVTHTHKIYTFEFLQHLLNFRDFSIELGSMLGQISLQQSLDGQPLQIMARYGEKEQKIWAFDLWHESLVEDSRKYDAKMPTDSLC